MIINAGGVTKKFYSFNGTIADTTTPANAAIKLTFSSNIFYAKIVAHLVEDSTEFSNMSLEVGGGSRAGSSFDDALLKATLEDARCQHTSLGKSAVAQLTSLLKGRYMNKHA